MSVSYWSVRKASVQLWVIVALVLLFFSWAYFAQFDQIISSEGRLIVDSKLQVAQHLEGGIVKEIHVKVGDFVKRGTVLISISPIEAEGGLDAKRSELFALDTKIKRLEAELLGTSFGNSDDSNIPDGSIVANEKSLLTSRRLHLKSSVAALNAQKNSRLSELEAAKDSLRLINEEKVVIDKLVERGLETKLEAVRMARSQSEAVARVKSLESGISELVEKMSVAVQENKTSVLTELTKSSSDALQIQKAMPLIENKLARTSIISPADGVVNRVLVSTIGGVLKGGEPAIEIVPRDSNLVFEAKVNPSDVGFLIKGQNAMIKLSAYDYSIYGSLNGELSLIGSDTISNEKGENYYPVRISLRDKKFRGVDKELPLVPGMVAQIDIVTGKRNFLSYLFSPVTKTMTTAFKEK